jgi:hypothetical protein
LPPPASPGGWLVWRREKKTRTVETRELEGVESVKKHEIQETRTWRGA